MALLPVPFDQPSAQESQESTPCLMRITCDISMSLSMALPSLHTRVRASADRCRSWNSQLRLVQAVSLGSSCSYLKTTPWLLQRSAFWPRFITPTLIGLVESVSMSWRVRNSHVSLSSVGDMKFCVFLTANSLKTTGPPLCRSARFSFQSKPCLELPTQTIPLQTTLHNDGRRTNRQPYRQRGNGLGRTLWPRALSSAFYDGDDIVNVWFDHGKPLGIELQLAEGETILRTEVWGPTPALSIYILPGVSKSSSEYAARIAVSSPRD